MAGATYVVRLPDAERRDRASIPVDVAPGGGGGAGFGLQAFGTTSFGG